MILTHVKKHNGIVFYGYEYDTAVPYWSMKLYEEACTSVAHVAECVYQIRSYNFHPGIKVL